MRFISNVLTLFHFLRVGRLSLEGNSLEVEYRGVRVEIENGSLWVDAGDRVFINCKRTGASSDESRGYGNELLQETERSLLSG